GRPPGEEGPPGSVPGQGRAGADERARADGHTAHDGGVAADGRAVLDLRLDHLPVRLGLQAAGLAGRAGAEIVDEHAAWANEPRVADGHPRAHEGVAGDLAV